MSGLQGFLGPDEEEESAPAPAPAPEPQAEAPPPQEQRGPPPGEEDDDTPPVSQDGRNVPLAALEAERAKRNDWKKRASETEGQLAEVRRQYDEMQRQLEELRKAPRAAPPPPPQQVPEPAPMPELPDPNQNPVGYITAMMQHQQRQAEERLVHERFNTSELLLRRQIGDEAVDQLMAEFQEAAAADPTLRMQVANQRDPFGWAHKTMQQRRAIREMGDDPNAFRAKLEAEIRAKLEAEMGAARSAAPAAPPAPGRAPLPRQQPSLAGVRSIAGRTVEDDGDVPLGDILRR